MGEILPKLSVVRSKPKLVEKIVELGLVADKKDLRKKRIGKNQSGGSRRVRSGSDDLVESDADSERENVEDSESK